MVSETFVIPLNTFFFNDNDIIDNDSLNETYQSIVDRQKRDSRVRESKYKV